MVTNPKKNGGIASPKNDRPVARLSNQEYCLMAEMTPIAIPMVT